MKYYKIEEFIKKTKLSRSTINRFYTQYPWYGSQRKKVGNRLNIPESHLKMFNKKSLIEENENQQRQIQNLQNLLRMVHKGDTLASKLWKQDWTWFGTISYSSDIQRTTCYNKMQRLYTELVEEFGQDNEIRLFFTTEAFETRDGHHTHFTLHFSNTYQHTRMCEFIKKKNSYDRVDIQPYTLDQAGLFYISKEGLNGVDWDYFSSDARSKIA